MGADILGFLALSLRAEEESLFLHKPIPVHMVLYRLRRAHMRARTCARTRTHTFGGTSGLCPAQALGVP